MRNGFRIGVRRDGTVMMCMPNHEPTPLSNIVAIAAHQFNSLALKSDGTVVGWNSASWNPMRSQMYSITGLSNVVAIAIGESPQGTRNLALKKDGTVAHWGEETVYKDATPPAGLSNVIAIAAGYNHSLALTKDGTVTGWGFNSGGQATGVPTLNEPYVTNGSVRINGQILSNVVAIAANHEYSLALKKDGTVIQWGRTANDPYRTTIPAGISNVVSIAVGDDYCLAITTNSAVAEKFRH